MESEGLRVVRRGIEAWNDQDLDALIGLLAPDIVWHTAGVLPDLDATYEGHEGVRHFFSQVVEPWRSIQVDVERVIDEREGQILLGIRFRAEGREGLKVDMPYFHVYRFDDGLQLTELRAFADEAEARREAGLNG